MDKRYVDEESLLSDAYRLGVKVFNDRYRPTFIVGLWRGGSRVGIAVQECLQYLGVKTDHVAIRTSYGGLASYPRLVEKPGTEIRVHNTHYLLENLCAEDRLLIVDDVYSTGLHVQAVISRLQQRLRDNMPEAVRVAAVWHKPTQNRTGKHPHYFVRETADWLVLPYELSGLSYDEIRAGKPYLEDIMESCRRYLETP